MIEPTRLVRGVIQRSVLASFNIARILTRFSVRVPDICVLFKKKKKLQGAPTTTNATPAVLKRIRPLIITNYANEAI